jgi:GT2 family glycosyltransferase
LADLAVVVVTWNVRDLLRECLRSVVADLDRSGLGATIWVVDNDSADGTPGMVAEAFPDVHLIASRENLGFAGGNNLALREISESRLPIPEYAWLLNPDTEVQPGATEVLLGSMAQLPRAGMLGPRLTYADDSFQHSAFRFPGLVQLAYELFPLPERFYDTAANGRYPCRLYAGAAPFPVDHPLGAAMMVRMAAVAQVGLLDDGYRMYCEEIDWCWRMRRAAWRTFCVPTAQVIHHAGRSADQVPVLSFRDLWMSRARLYARHHGPVTWWLAQAMVRARMQQWIRQAERKGSQDLVAAHQEVLQAWERARRKGA